MTVLEQIEQAAAGRGLEFLVIGGLAVIEHGYPRLTFDVDLLVRREARATWRELLTARGYAVVEEKDNFEQYAKAETSAWPVDLMFVNASTFDGLWAAAQSVRIQGAAVRMVCLEHLIALKLHVLKQGELHRFLKDFQDVVELVRINKLDLRSPQVHGLFLRYGSAELYGKIRRSVGHE